MNAGKIIQEIGSFNFQINQIRMLKMTEEMVGMLYPEHIPRPYFGAMVQFLTSDVVIGIEVVGENSIEALKRVAGPTNPK